MVVKQQIRPNGWSFPRRQNTPMGYIQHSLKLAYNRVMSTNSRSHWPRGWRRRPAAARLLRLLVRIPPGAWIFVCCECCVLSGTGLCDELIIRPEEAYRLWCFIVCDLETSWMRRPWPSGGCCAKNIQTNKQMSTNRKASEGHVHRPVCLWTIH